MLDSMAFFFSKGTLCSRVYKQSELHKAAVRYSDKSNVQKGLVLIHMHDINSAGDNESKVVEGMLRRFRGGKQHLRSFKYIGIKIDLDCNSI